MGKEVLVYGRGLPAAEMMPGTPKFVSGRELGDGKLGAGNEKWKPRSWSPSGNPVGWFM